MRYFVITLAWVNNDKIIYSFICIGCTIYSNNFHIWTVIWWQLESKEGISGKCWTYSLLTLNNCKLNEGCFCVPNDKIKYLVLHKNEQITINHVSQLTTLFKNLFVTWFTNKIATTISLLSAVMWDNKCHVQCCNALLVLKYIFKKTFLITGCGFNVAQPI